MYKKLFKACGFLVLLSNSAATFAAVTFGEVAENLFGPVTALTSLMFAASYALALALALFAVLQFRAHRNNPKLVPLSIPIVLAICSIILFFIPKVTTSGKTWAATEQSKRAIQHDFIQHPGYHDSAIELPKELPPPAEVHPSKSVPQHSAIFPAASHLDHDTPSSDHPKIYIDEDEPPLIIKEHE